MDTKSLVKFKKLYAENMSYQNIANEFGMKRSAVETLVSKLRRKGEIAKSRPRTSSQYQKRGRSQHTKTPYMIVYKAHNHKLKEVSWDFQPLGKGVTLLDLEPMQCHWPCNDGLYCGAEAMKSHGYCAYHILVSARGQEKADEIVKENLRNA